MSNTYRVLYLYTDTPALEVPPYTNLHRNHFSTSSQYKEFYKNTCTYHMYIACIVTCTVHINNRNSHKGNLQYLS